MFDLTDKVALVTGGNGGIGLAFAKGLVKCGAKVAIWGRNADKNRESVAILRDLGADVEAFEADVTDIEQVNAAFAATLSRFKKVDICFANAGGSGTRGYLHQTAKADWDRVMDININGVVNTFKPVITHLLERKSPGKLIINSSAAAIIGTGFQASYSTTKTAVVGLARALAVELGPNQIQVNALLPGYVETDFTTDTPQAFKDACLRRSCSKRHGRVEDMEGVAVFLASKESDFMTGQSIVMDGGMTIYPL
jgi:NAD(P)-dependent dehydrogenase (short-subunit alcohol dehydrogenase family)